MRIVILGAGYGGLRAALDLDRWLGDRDDVEIVLVDQNDHHQLVTELHKPAAGTVSAARTAVRLADILHGTRIQFCQRRVRDILPEEDAVRLEGGATLRYHRLVVALGSAPEYFNIPGVAEHALTISSINSARVIRAHVEEAFRQGVANPSSTSANAAFTVVVAGGGFTGVELAGELADRLPRLAKELGASPERVNIQVIEALPELLSGFSPRLVQEAARALKAKRVKLLLGVPIASVERGAVTLKDGRRIAAGTVIWTGGVRGNPMVERRFPSKMRGRAEVDAYLRSPAFPDVYLIGDCAYALDPKTGHPVAPTAKHAIEQGRVVARNVWAEFTGRPLRPYRPMSKGMIVSVGRGVGLARLGRYDVFGAGPAVLKDAITWRYLYSIGGYRLLLRYMLDSFSSSREDGDGAASRNGRRLAGYRSGELPPGATLCTEGIGDGDGAGSSGMTESGSRA